MEIRRLSKLIRIEDNLCQLQRVADTLCPRTKITFFSITPTSDNTNNSTADNNTTNQDNNNTSQVVGFQYMNHVTNVSQGVCFVEMRVSHATQLELNDVLWSNSQFGGDYHLNRELLAELKKILRTSLDDTNLIKLLLCVGEAESGGASGN
jgi:hypothetical protein